MLKETFSYSHSHVIDISTLKEPEVYLVLKGMEILFSL